MKIQCPHCGVKGTADDSYNGKQVKCPKCKGVFAALTIIPEAPLQEQPLPTEVLQPAEPDSSITPAACQDTAEAIEQQEDIAEDIGAAVDSAWPDEEIAEDITDILTAEDVPEGDKTEPEESALPVVEQEDVFSWTDIASEIDEEMAKGAEQSKEEDGDPASLTSFFTDDAPAADDVNMQAEGPPASSSDETLTPGTDIEPMLNADLPEEGRGEAKEAGDEIESKPYGMDKEQCWQCGKKDSVGVPFIAKGGRLYCSDCLPVEKPEAEEEMAYLPPDFISKDLGREDDTPKGPGYGFSIVGIIKEAWAKTKGAKASVWAGSAIMYLTLLVLIAGGSFLLPSQMNHAEGFNIIGVVGNVLFQLIVNVIMVIFSAGLLYIGIRKVADEPIGWKMIFEGFSIPGKLVVAAILQTLLIVVGFMLLILPGIYLAIGYAMTVPLIVDRKMSPWQAMEMSRKAIHGKWWKVFGLYFVMGLLAMVSALPLGLGLIWTWPMFIVLGGVVYHSLFGIDRRGEE